jgi:tetratricopeptide (TPR) repeat protein
MEILSQGIRFHPSYIMGYLGLAFCYYDLKQFNLAYSTIRPLIENNRDNLRLQKLFADICLELGKQEEGLETLKYLLFINPRDKEVAELVTDLEKEIEERYRPHHKPIFIPENELTESSKATNNPDLFDVTKLHAANAGKNDFDDWMTIDMSHEQKQEGTSSAPSRSVPSPSTTSYDQWNVKKSNEVHDATSSEQTYKVHLDLDDEDAAADEGFRPVAQTKKEDSTPMVTHTLVDLYCGQGHIEKALEVLGKILLLNPHDQKTIRKIKEIELLVQPLDQYDHHEIELEKNTKKTKISGAAKSAQVMEINDLDDLDETTEEDGRRHLMSLIDEKLGPIKIEERSSKSSLKLARVEAKLSSFLKKLQKRALDYQSRV